MLAQTHPHAGFICNTDLIWELFCQRWKRGLRKWNHTKTHLKCLSLYLDQWKCIFRCLSHSFFRVHWWNDEIRTLVCWNVELAKLQYAFQSSTVCKIHLSLRYSWCISQNCCIYFWKYRSKNSSWLQFERGLRCSKVPKWVSGILLCTSGAATLTGRRRQQQGRETITLLLMEWLSESERYLGGVHRRSNNSVLCIVSSHTAFQMAGCGYASFHFSAEPLLLWITSPSSPLPEWRLLQVAMTQTIIWPLLKGKFFPLWKSISFCSILSDIPSSSPLLLCLKFPFAG